MKYSNEFENIKVMLEGMTKEAGNTYIEELLRDNVITDMQEVELKQYNDNL